MVIRIWPQNAPWALNARPGDKLQLCAGPHLIAQVIPASFGRQTCNAVSKAYPTFVALRTIAQYRLLRRLGDGGMGEVFLAEDTRLERRVALKVMSAELARDEAQRKRFRAEAKAASGLSHPNICVIHEVGETPEGRPFLAMEYVEGQSLAELLQQRRLRIPEVLKLGIQVAQALQAAHARGLVHRDIKPANIMLDASGRTKVLDFGLAKRFTEEELGTATTSVPLTRTGMLIGTPHYMSPEHALGRDLDQRSDIFSVGVVLYEAVVGQRPFLGRTVGEVLNELINHQPEPLGLDHPLYSPALDRVIFRCLEKDPAKRYPSAEALAADLLELQKQAEQAASRQTETCCPPPLASAPPAAPRINLQTTSGRSRVGLAIAASVALAALLGLALLANSRGWFGRRGGPPASATSVLPPNSVAVLPFDNFSPEGDTDYLSEGLTEEITAALSRLRGLKVAARNSAFTFKGKKDDIRKIGAALRVGAILDGSIRKVGKQIRVTAQLINVADGYNMWAETYDRTVDDIIAVQRDIARQIAARLQSGEEPANASFAQINPQAHEYYLRGRLFWNKRTETALAEAVGLFQQAIARDPNYADAHAALAATFLVQPLYSKQLRASECAPRARASAMRALELDPACAEAHAVLGTLQSDAHNLKAAEEHFRRAIALDQNNATAHQWFGRYLLLHGKRLQALAELQIAADLDPLSPAIQTSVVQWRYLGGEYDRAIVDAQKLIDAFPDFPAAHMTLIMARFMKGQYQQALSDIARARSAGARAEDPLAFLDAEGYAWARLGERAKAESILARLESERQKGQQVDGAIGFVLIGLKEYDKAAEVFERLAATECFDEGLLIDPCFDEVRNLPRFQTLLKKVGLVTGIGDSSPGPA